jgi:hypothetical protein
MQRMVVPMRYLVCRYIELRLVSRRMRGDFKWNKRYSGEFKNVEPFRNLELSIGNINLLYQDEK